MVIDAGGRDLGPLTRVLGIEGRNLHEIEPAHLERLAMIAPAACTGCGRNLLIVSAVPERLFLMSKLCGSCADEKPKAKPQPTASSLERLVRLLEGR